MQRPGRPLCVRRVRNEPRRGGAGGAGGCRADVGAGVAQICALATFVGKSRGDFSSAQQLYKCAPRAACGPSAPWPPAPEPEPDALARAAQARACARPRPRLLASQPRDAAPHLPQGARARRCPAPPHLYHVFFVGAATPISCFFCRLASGSHPCPAPAPADPRRATTGPRRGARQGSCLRGRWSCGPTTPLPRRAWRCCTTPPPAM
jgi:hypothetical protein